MTGIYLRVERQGTWINQEIEYLTKEELEHFAQGETSIRLARFIEALCMQIRNQPGWICMNHASAPVTE